MMQSVCNSALRQSTLLAGRRISEHNSLLTLRALSQAASNSEESANSYARIASIVGASLAATVLYSQSSSNKALCDERIGDNSDATLANLKAWLESKGVTLDKVEIRASEEGSGYGVFAKEDLKSLKQEKKKWSWFRSKTPENVVKELPTLATFPFRLSISAVTVSQDPVLGNAFSYMLDKNILDERTAVMAYLAFQRACGTASPVAPWLQALPQQFDTPLYFSEEELAELRGTVLASASESVQRRLQDTWAKLGPIFAKLAGDLKLQKAPSLDDFRWAYSVFWSRGQSIPVPEAGSATLQLSDAAASSSLGVVEGIVPGLDFFNHRPRPQCWWDVLADPKSYSLSLNLHMHVDKGAQAGEELFISYGDKSNEELLMLYGFAVDQNPDEHIMLHCPVPAPADLDEMMTTKLELLQAYGLKSQFFLRAKDVENIPRDVLDTLEVFVLKHDELVERVEECKDFLKSNNLNREDVTVIPVREQRKDVDLKDIESRKATMSREELAAAEKQLGLRMATISTLVRMLEVKIVDLEGVEGTGPLEADRALLKRAEQLPVRQRASVIYRAGQKQLTRDMLAASRQYLAKVLKLMTQLRDLSRALDSKK